MSHDQVTRWRWWLITVLITDRWSLLSLFLFLSLSLSLFLTLSLTHEMSINSVFNLSLILSLTSTFYSFIPSLTFTFYSSSLLFSQNLSLKEINRQTQRKMLTRPIALIYIYSLSLSLFHKQVCIYCTYHLQIDPCILGCLRRIPCRSGYSVPSL